MPGAAAASQVALTVRLAHETALGIGPVLPPPPREAGVLRKGRVSSAPPASPAQPPAPGRPRKTQLGA